MVQFYAEGAQSVADKNTHRICPSATGGTNFWPSSYSRKTGYLYILARRRFRWRGKSNEIKQSNALVSRN